MKTRKIAYLGMLMALALVLSYVESLIPFAVGIPGVKLGLTNIVTVIMLYIAAPMETFLLCVFRAVLSGLYVWKCIQYNIFTGRLYTKLYRYVPA